MLHGQLRGRTFLPHGHVRFKKAVGASVMYCILKQLAATERYLHFNWRDAELGAQCSKILQISA
jgi:hypothetical protein